MHSSAGRRRSRVPRATVGAPSKTLVYGDDRWAIWQRDAAGMRHRLRDFTAIQNLQVFELITALAHGGQCIAILVAILQYDATRKVPLRIPYVTWPKHGSADKSFGYRVFSDGSIDIAWCIFGFFLLSFVFQMSAVVLWKKTTNCLLDYYVQPFRWIEYSISASLMAIIFALLNGIQETTFIYNMFLSFFTTMILGLMQELVMSAFKRTQERAALLRDSLAELEKFEPTTRSDFDSAVTALTSDIQSNLNLLPDEPTSWRNTRWVPIFLPHLLGWVPFVSVVSVFIATFSLAVSRSPEPPPSWVYFLYSFQFVIMSSFAVVQIVEQLYIYWEPVTRPGSTELAIDTQKERCRRYAVRAEFAYTTLSLVAKSVLCWVLFTNVLVEKQISYTPTALPPPSPSS